MSKNQVTIYLASGWFTPRTREILDHMESVLSAHPLVNLYSPRRDGIVLPPNQKHDTAIRESIFKENISKILEADIVVANIDSGDHYNDPGTIYEVGYAMANNIPVVGFTLSKENIDTRFKGIIRGFECIVNSYEELTGYIAIHHKSHIKDLRTDNHKQKVLFVGNGNDSVDSKLAAIIIESGASIRWVNEHDEIYSRIDEIFKDVQYMIVVIDDRKTLVSWMIGQAYARNIPVITYSDFNYGVNVMLLCSLVTHLRGDQELTSFLQKVKREGLESIPPFDISTLDSM